MRVLRQGLQGPDVKKWQWFLNGQRLDAGPADGDFGPVTHKATIQFQVRHALYADGIVGLRTLGQAMKLGFEPVELQQSPRPAQEKPAWEHPYDDDPSWPPRPSFEALLSTAERQKLWGKFSYEAVPLPGNPENLRILGDWEAQNLVRVEIPQLHKIPGLSTSGVMRFHRKAGDQLRELWRRWEARGLLRHILTYDGAFSPRFIRGSRTALSNHAHGTAFDINAAWNALGARPALAGQRGSVRDLVKTANECGFYWGGHFNNRPDGMHFEVARDLKL
jgi:peptidoglycan hydrolase-like protein with peptidoglycan-binding domain